jgi:unspecific monooxygenase
MQPDGSLNLRQLPSTGLTQTQLTIAYETDRLGFLRRCVDEHGPLVQIGPETFLVADPAFTMNVLRHTHDQFEITRALGREPAQGSRSPGHDNWMTWRDVILGAQKNEQALDEHLDWVTAHTEKFCDRWIQVCRIKDLRMELELLSATSFARYAYGDGAYQDVVAKTQDFLRALLVIIGSPIEIPYNLRFLPRRRRFLKTREALEVAIGDAIPLASENSLVGEIRDSGYAPELLGRFMATMHAAGTVPTAVLMWALLELGRHPDMAEEIAETGDSDHFVKEILRLWPATWLIMRETLEDVTSEGVTFPAGSVVLLSPYLVHRYAPCFDDQPDAFRPDRWKGLRPPPGSYIPFGAGPSWCLGGRFAERELNTIVPVLARRLRVHVDTPEVKIDARRSLQPQLSSLRVSARG